MEKCDLQLPVRIIPDDWVARLDLTRAYGKDTDGLEVDVGSGKGRFLLARARANPNIPFLGIERLLSRVRQVERKAMKEKLGNLRVIYVDAEYAIRYLLPAGSVSVFYVLFNDPWPKRKHVDRRMVNGTFVDALCQALKAGGKIHLATDDADYFRAISKQMAADSRLEPTPIFEPTEDERTDYELLWLREKRVINRCSFQSKNSSVHGRPC